jgi:hypothetical protein
MHPHVFGIPFSSSQEFDLLRPLRVSGSSMSTDGRRFVGKFLSDSILTCHTSYHFRPYSEVQIVSCSSLFNASRLALFEELPGDVFVAIHGTTSSSNVASIAANGFRLSPAGCFGQGIYLAQNSSVALVHTCPKGQDFRSTIHFIQKTSQDGESPPALNLIICFVKMRSHGTAVYPPKPVMEMIYNGFPSTADRLSPLDVVIGDMPFRFFEAVANDASRVYAAWHVQVHLVRAEKVPVTKFNRDFLARGKHACFGERGPCSGDLFCESDLNLVFGGYSSFSLGIVRLPNGRAAICRFCPLAFRMGGLEFAADKFLFAPLTPLQWAVVKRDFQTCARLLRAGNRAHFELPDFSLEELAERLPQFTFPKIPGVSKNDLFSALAHDQMDSLGAVGLHVRSTGLDLKDNLLRLLMASTPDFHNPDSQYDTTRGWGTEQDVRPMFYDPFPEILPVLRRIRDSPSHLFDAAADAELVQAFKVNSVQDAKRKADAQRRGEAQRRREAEEDEEQVFEWDDEDEDDEDGEEEEDLEQYEDDEDEDEEEDLEQY